MKNNNSSTLEGVTAPNKSLNDYANNRDHFITDTNDLKSISDLVIRWFESGVSLSINSKPITNYLC